MTSVSLSSLESVVSLMRANPRLLNIPALQPLRPLLQQPQAEGCCGQKPDLSGYRRVFENALRALTDQQKEQLKEILGADRVTYYARSGNDIVQKTI
ncbi:hypothetical protein EKK58_01305 [Candidatus Dependentiae bacterium]|nr:MAG: hypothetical protein EKK58_01305 [Candidatus Dependentiae bacterium]